LVVGVACFSCSWGRRSLYTVLSLVSINRLVFYSVFYLCSESYKTSSLISRQDQTHNGTSLRLYNGLLTVGRSATLS
jgi:hypothetical protein